MKDYKKMKREIVKEAILAKHPLLGQLQAKDIARVLKTTKEYVRLKVSQTNLGQTVLVICTDSVETALKGMEPEYYNGYDAVYTSDFIKPILEYVAI